MRHYILAIALCASSAATVRGQETWMIYQAGPSGLRVELLPSDAATPAKALVVWSDGLAERWRVVGAGWRVPAGLQDAPALTAADTPTRSVALAGSGTSEFAQFTLELDQLRAAVVARDLESAFLTPPRESACLSGRITIRRMPRTQGAMFPAGTAVLSQAGIAKKSWRIAFAEGQEKCVWSETGAPAKEFPEGLPPGSYALVMAGKKTVFQIEPAGLAARVLQPIANAEALLGKKDPPLFAAFAFDHLLGQLDDNAVPKYLADALDFLDRQPQVSVRLKKQRALLLDWLRTPPEQRARAIRSAQASREQPVGIDEIDAARGLLERGDKDAAAKLLKRFTGAGPGGRARGLAELYLGVLEAEGGAACADKAEQHFGRAAELLASAPAADRLRLYNNRADYFHQQAQDHLYNHALRMAAGVDRPLASVLRSWTAALTDYTLAAKLADESKLPAEQAALAVNLARHHALLADFVRTLDANKSAGEIAAAADAQAQAWSAAALKASASIPLLSGMALELKAQLAFRNGAADDASKLARQAQAHYLDAGFVAGIENLQRLQALAATDADEALGHYRLSALISESLRQRMPADRMGAGRAGFFARKAWVFDKMAELLIKQDRAEEALQIVELARARTLQDCLPTNSRLADALDPQAAEMSALLARWPAETVALEYFLGGEHACVFFIGTNGKVRAIPLTDERGRPLASKALVGRVHHFLRDVEGQSAKMAQRILAKKGFDHVWQDDLHGLYQTLVPTEIRKEIAQAKTTVIVPQHILHYFPFAALVTQRDAQARGPRAMAMPRFWIEEPGQRVIAPSLTLWHSLRGRALEPVRQVTAIGLVQAPGADRLDGVEADLKNLQAAFGPHLRQIVDGKQASVAVARQALSMPGMLFIGTHGFNDGERPLQSFLLLMPAPDGKTPEEQSGRLTAQAVFDLSVRADLVVMSACYSGLGERSPLPGDDLFGLQRAFLQSGSRAVIAGLWDVFDGTAPDLMNGFFERFSKGESAADALQNSQRGFLQNLRTSGKTEPYLHPYFWAVYSLIGDGRVQFTKKAG